MPQTVGLPLRKKAHTTHTTVQRAASFTGVYTNRLDSFSVAGYYQLIPCRLLLASSPSPCFYFLLKWSVLFPLLHSGHDIRKWLTMDFSRGWIPVSSTNDIKDCVTFVPHQPQRGDVVLLLSVHFPSCWNSLDLYFRTHIIKRRHNSFS